MPIIKSRSKGKTCYQFGKEGKRYCGRGAKTKAEKQGRAIESSKERRRK